MKGRDLEQQSDAWLRETWYETYLALDVALEELCEAVRASAKNFVYLRLQKDVVMSGGEKGSLVDLVSCYKAFEYVGEAMSEHETLDMPGVVVVNEEAIMAAKAVNDVKERLRALTSVMGKRRQLYGKEKVQKTLMRHTLELRGLARVNVQQLNRNIPYMPTPVRKVGFTRYQPRYYRHVKMKEILNMPRNHPEGEEWLAVLEDLPKRYRCNICTVVAGKNARLTRYLALPMLVMGDACGVDIKPLKGPVDGNESRRVGGRKLENDPLVKGANIYRYLEDYRQYGVRYDRGFVINNSL